MFACVGRRTLRVRKKIPSDVIQPEVMEPLLYDYHLATTLSSDLVYTENYKKDAYLNYVFKSIM